MNIGNHIDVMGRMGGAGSNERRHASGLRDAFLEYGAIGCLFVIEKAVPVHRIIVLSHM
jgi:hypothetical protein